MNYTIVSENNYAAITTHTKNVKSTPATDNIICGELSKMDWIFEKNFKSIDPFYRPQKKNGRKVY